METGSQSNQVNLGLSGNGSDRWSLGSNALQWPDPRGANERARLPPEGLPGSPNPLWNVSNLFKVWFVDVGCTHSRRNLSSLRGWGHLLQWVSCKHSSRSLFALPSFTSSPSLTQFRNVFFSQCRFLPLRIFKLWTYFQSTRRQAQLHSSKESA